MRYKEIFELLEEVRVRKKALVEAEKSLKEAEGSFRAAEDALMQHLREEVEEPPLQGKIACANLVPKPKKKKKSRSKKPPRLSRRTSRPEIGPALEWFYKNKGYATIARKHGMGTAQPSGSSVTDYRSGVWLTESEREEVNSEYMGKYRDKAPAQVTPVRVVVEKRSRYNSKGLLRMQYGKRNPRPSTDRKGTGEKQEWYRSAQYRGAARDLEVGETGQLKERGVLNKGVWLTSYEIELIKEWKKDRS